MFSAVAAYRSDENAKAAAPEGRVARLEVDFSSRVRAHGVEIG
jgi:hypothetical protein